MKPKLKRLPHDYLAKYLNKDLSKSDYLFIKGCMSHQERYVQLNNLQWEIIKKIEQKYL